jgi:Ca2+/Na+ antiporter
MLVLTPWAITVNRQAFTFVFPAITLVYPSSCSIKFFVTSLSAVMTISPLSSFCYWLQCCPLLLFLCCTSYYVYVVYSYHLVALLGINQLFISLGTEGCK